jgi:hypothetical protein
MPQNMKTEVQITNQMIVSVSDAVPLSDLSRAVLFHHNYNKLLPHTVTLLVIFIHSPHSSLHEEIYNSNIDILHYYIFWLRG